MAHVERTPPEAGGTSLLAQLANDPATSDQAGRVMLWFMALHESERLLADADRANRELAAAVAAASTAPLSPPAPPPPGGDALPQFLSSLGPLERTGPFTHLADLFNIRDNFRMLAMVVFMRMWNRGDELPDTVASNMKSAEVLRLRSVVVQTAFPESKEREEFDSLLTLLRQARDGVVAHSDGKCSGVTHNPGVGVSATISSQVLQGVNFDFWLHAVRRLQSALRDRRDTSAR